MKIIIRALGETYKDRYRRLRLERVRERECACVGVHVCMREDEVKEANEMKWIERWV